MAPPVQPARSSTGMLWNTMPGWGITANLLPPEIVTARRVRVLRKLVIAAIGFVLALGIAGYAYGYLQEKDANSQLSAAQARTGELTAQQAKYQGVVTISGDIDQVKTQLATLLTTDVDGAALLDSIQQRAPHGTIQTVTLTLSGSAAGAIPDADGQLPVGTVTVTGSTTSMAEVATSVDQLKTLPGLSEIYPTTQQNNGKSVQYTIQITLVDKVYSHRWDFAPGAGQTSGGK
jgi:hypothetical protein